MDALTKLAEIQARLDKSSSDPLWLNEDLATLRDLIAAAPSPTGPGEPADVERAAAALCYKRDIATIAVARGFMPPDRSWLTAPDAAFLIEARDAANRARAYAWLLFPDNPATAEEIAAVTAVAAS